MSRKITILIAALLLLPSLASARALSLGEISAYLNSMRAAESMFVQSNPDKTLAQGVMYLEKPGRIRYEYTTPADSLVISDGRYLGVFDKKSNRGVQAYDLKGTPLDILLSNSVDLTASGVVRDIRSDGTQTRVVAVDPNNRRSGSLTMVFTADPIELRQWIVSDPLGRKTTVILSNLKLRSDIPNEFFDLAKTAAAYQ